MAALIYIAAVFGVTAFFNIPLNELLDKFDLNNTAPSDLKVMRTRHKMPWNRWHTIRLRGQSWHFLQPCWLLTNPTFLKVTDDIT